MVILGNSCFNDTCGDSISETENDKIKTNYCVAFQFSKIQKEEVKYTMLHFLGVILGSENTSGRAFCLWIIILYFFVLFVNPVIYEKDFHLLSAKKFRRSSSPNA